MLNKSRRTDLGGRRLFLHYPGTMATADCTTSTQDEGDCWQEGLHSLSCSEDEDRGELVCTGLILI